MDDAQPVPDPLPEPLPDGFDPRLPVADNLLKAYTYEFATLMERTATALGWRAERNDRFVAIDGGGRFPFQNCAVPLRPPVDHDVFDAIDDFYAGHPGGSYLIWAATPIPDQSARGWTVMGHPPLMCRPPGPADVPRPEGLEIAVAHDDAAVGAFTSTVAEAFPIESIIGLPYAGYGPGLLDVADWTMYVGYLDGKPVATAAASVHASHVDVEWVSARPEIRGRRIGEALTWAATRTDPAKPAMLIASDAGQPVYERMGYLRLCRISLWVGSRPPA